MISEMLGRNIAFLNQATTRKTEAVDFDVNESGWYRGRVLFQLGVNYEWSSVVYDDRREGGRAATVEDAYGGGEMHSVRAGDRAPNAPALHVLPRSESATTATTTSLFEIFHVSKHTILVFVPQNIGKEQSKFFLDVTRSQLLGLCSIVLVFEKGTEEHSIASVIEIADLAVLDTAGYAFRLYAAKSQIRTVVVRPDLMAGAMMGSTEGLEHYFSLVFDGGK